MLHYENNITRVELIINTDILNVTVDMEAMNTRTLQHNGSNLQTN